MTTKPATSVSVEQPNQPPNPPPGFIRPPHGRGLLRTPWQKGERGNPNNRLGEYHEVRSLARKTSLVAMHKLIAKMDFDDERVALIAIQAVLERAWGPPRAVDLSELNRPAMQFDLRQLTREEIQLLIKMTRTGAIRPADDAPADTAP